MKDSQLEKMNMKALRELRDQVDEAIKSGMVRDRADLKAKMAELAAEHGLSLQDVLGGGRGRKSGTVAIKFQNPKNAAETWTGRGRRPNWMTKLGASQRSIGLGSNGH